MEEQIRKLNALEEEAINAISSPFTIHMTRVFMKKHVALVEAMDETSLSFLWEFLSCFFASVGRCYKDHDCLLGNLLVKAMSSELGDLIRAFGLKLTEEDCTSLMLEELEGMEPAISGEDLEKPR
jgi:hypothetical protein